DQYCESGDICGGLDHEVAAAPGHVAQDADRLGDHQAGQEHGERLLTYLADNGDHGAPQVVGNEVTTLGPGSDPGDIRERQEVDVAQDAEIGLVPQRRHGIPD